MPGLAKPEPAFGIDLRLEHAVVATEACFGCDEIELGQSIERVSQRAGDAADFRTEPA